MCRGCRIYRSKKFSCEEYLDWFDKYSEIIQAMKKLEKELLAFNSGVDNALQKNTLDSFRKKLIKERRQYAKATTLLDSI